MKRKITKDLEKFSKNIEQRFEDELMRCEISG